MKKMRARLLSVITISALLLSGCGTSLYEMTDSEQEVIVHYAAHVLAKHNIFQKDGMTNDSLEETEEDSEDTQEKESEKTEDNSENKLPEGSASDDKENNTNEISLAEAIGHAADLTVTYEGCSISDTYEGGSYYSVKAPTGSTYLIMKFNLTNNGKTDVTVNSLEYAPGFVAKVGETKVSAEVTILLDDFSSYQGTIAPGQTVSNVLLFGIPKTSEDKVQNPSLTVTKDGSTSSIKL